MTWLHCQICMLLQAACQLRDHSPDLDHLGQSGADAKGGWQVIEAAIENVRLKQQIFADLEKACRPDAILSSNTSTIDISLVRQLTPSLTGHSRMLWPA